MSQDCEHKVWTELSPEEKDAVIPALLEALGLQISVVDKGRYKSVELQDVKGEVKGSCSVL